MAQLRIHLNDMQRVGIIKEARKFKDEAEASIRKEGKLKLEQARRGLETTRKAGCERRCL